MTTTTTTLQPHEYPEVVDEKVDENFWKVIESAITMLVNGKPKHEKMYLYLRPEMTYAEKSSLPNEAEVGRVINVADLAEVAKDIEGMTPFIVRTGDEYQLAPDSQLDFLYPDLQSVIFKVFEPAGMPKAGCALKVRPKSEK